MEHVTQYPNAMFMLVFLEDWREVVMCKIFATSLKGAALSWFISLKVDSINSFEELVSLEISLLSAWR